MSAATATSVDAALAAFAAADTPLPVAVAAAAAVALDDARERAAAGDPALAAWDAALRPLLPVAELAPAWTAYRIALAAERARAEAEPADEAALARTLVAAAALAVGPQSPEQAQQAVARGWELTLRLAATLGAGQRERGWSLAGADGAIGAAVAAGRLLGCSPRQLGWAIGLAATQAAGFARLLADHDGRAQLAGKTAFNGVEAALLARAGVNAAPEPVAGRRGLLALTAPGTDAAPLAAGLGERWLVAV